MTQKNTPYDIAIIGGGINGAGIARDASGQGLKTLLLEADDLGQATSSASTKLIHGGLRYLEYYEFSLVRKALKERETLLELAPHIIWPLEFILPHNAGMRPKWMIRAGLWLYDNLARRKHLPGSRAVRLDDEDVYGRPLAGHLKNGFSYSDCWVEDSRLVLLNALDASERGADIRLHERCQEIKALDNSHWSIKSEKGDYEARMLVNATGPWVDQFLDSAGPEQESPRQQSIRLVKGSHIVVPKIYEGDHCYTLQLPDGRAMFVIPYEKNYTLIGTTEEAFRDDPGKAGISDEEISYMCRFVSENFKTRLDTDDVIWTYSGVRPLLEDTTKNDEKNASKVTRDYRLVKTFVDDAPLVSVYGGKITTYRVLAQDVMFQFGHKTSWTANAPLPGGDIPDADFDTFLSGVVERYDFLDPRTVKRLARQFGTRIKDVLGPAKALSDLGEHYGDDIYEAEIRYFVKQEWARTVDDILYRRTKLGLHITPRTKKRIEQALKSLLSESVSAQ